MHMYGSNYFLHMHHCIKCKKNKGTQKGVVRVQHAKYHDNY